MIDSNGTHTRAAAIDGDLPPEEGAHRQARSWIHQFARTLKTCKLYDANNPTVERFLQDLTQSLTRFLDEHGPLPLRFTSEDVLYEDVSLYPARSRDDNLAMPFYRDGIRSLTLNPGITHQEVIAIVHAIMRSGAHNASRDDDLVTLLWEAKLDHAGIEYVPAEGDVAIDESDESESMPWPDPEDLPIPQVVTIEDDPETSDSGRSDDWAIRDLTAEVEAGFAELEALASTESARFHDEYRAEHEVPLTVAAIAIVQAYFDCDVSPQEGSDVSAFLQRVLREALNEGRWLEAAEAASLLARHGGKQWSEEVFCQELMQPISVTGAAAKLNLQDQSLGQHFVEFASRLGEPAVDLVIAVLGQVQAPRIRRVLSQFVVDACREQPERLAPWLADPNPRTVLNVVEMLGAIGGPAVVGMLESFAGHEDPRVVHGVVTALRNVPPEAARPVLLSMIGRADSRTFCAALRGLSRARDPEAASCLIRLLQAPDFERRGPSERHALYVALTAAGGDEIVPALELELHRGSWFSQPGYEHILAVARCLSGLGTTSSRAVLEGGLRSRRPAVRKACEAALDGWKPRT